MDNTHAQEHHTEKAPSYLPMVLIVVVLGFVAWMLLNSFHGRGNMWNGNKPDHQTEAAAPAAEHGGHH